MDVVPGAVSAVLSDPGVGLFRADERVFEAMIGGWRAQMLARGLTTQTIMGRCGVLARFQRFAGTFPWQWRAWSFHAHWASLRRSAARFWLSSRRCWTSARAAARVDAAAGVAAAASSARCAVASLICSRSRLAISDGLGPANVSESACVRIVNHFAG